MVMDADTRSAFLRALDEDPEFHQAVRQRLLSEELLALPQRLAAFIEATERRLGSLEATLTGFIDEQREFNRQTLEHQKRTDERFSQVDERFSQVDERFSQVDERFNQVDERFNQVDERFNQVDERFDRIEHRLDRITDDVGFLKGNVVISAARAHHEFILEELGFNFVKMLPRDEIIDMLRNADPAGDIPFNDRRSFYEADVMIRVSDDRGAIRYVVMEASFTADHRDTDRVIRNAEFLTRFTGCPAHPVIVSVRNDREIQPLLNDGTVHWYRVTEQDLQPS